MKRPSFQLYPGDWQRDIALRSCSIAARGLWFEMMCIMHQAEPYGHLILNGKGIGAEQLANIVGGISKAEVTKLLGVLESEAVFSRTPDGVIYSRRMVRDEAVRNKRAEGGSAGAEHGKKGAEFGGLGGRPQKDKGEFKPPLDTGDEGANKPPLKPPPSSSSSSSSSTSKSKAIAPSKLDATALVELGADDQAANDWMMVRKAKRAPLTQTVIESMQREAAKAGLTFGKAVSICAERGWQAFRADWNWQQGSITSAGPNRQQSLEERNRIVAENWRPPEETHAGS